MNHIEKDLLSFLLACAMVNLRWLNSYSFFINEYVGEDFFMQKKDIKVEIEDLKQIFLYSKKIGFFLGAGTSCAMGLPNVWDLTKEVESRVNPKLVEKYRIVKNLVPKVNNILPENVTIEHILNLVRQIKDLTNARADLLFLEISGTDSMELDREICKQIYCIISEKEANADTLVMRRFIAWLGICNNYEVKEIFTTNYDLIVERSLEKNEIPYFDGFVGGYEPFFWPESIEKEVLCKDLTYSWVRLWKIHGSLNWEFKNGSSRIIRTSRKEIPTNELVIYPSKEKYNLSRKQPFIAYFDRLKQYLRNGEITLVMSGYSFADQHINDIIFSALRENTLLFCLVFCYSDDQVNEMEKFSTTFLNLSVYGPNRGIIRGTVVEWEFPEEQDESTKSYLYEGKELGLGDFSQLAEFLITSSGKTINTAGDDDEV